MSLRLLAVASLLVSWFVESQAAEKAETKASAPEAVQVKLLDPGAEPRETLRYRVDPGRKETMVIEMRVTAALESPGFKAPEGRSPPLRMTFAFDSRERKPSGAVRCGYRLNAAEVVQEGNEPSSLAQAMKPQLAAVVGLSGERLIDSRGFVLEHTTNPHPTLKGPEEAKVMPAVLDSFRLSTVVPLPEEAVGRGARWEVNMPVSTQAMKLTQIATYAMMERKGDEVRCDVSLVQTAASQALGGLPPGASANLKALSAKGTGTLVLRLGEIVSRSRIELDSTGEMSVQNTGGQPRTITIRTRTELRSEPGPAASAASAGDGRKE